jgi:hypothetical protein
LRVDEQASTLEDTTMNPVTTAAYLVCLAISRDLPASQPRTVDEILKEHGLPLFAAKDVRLDASRWTLWAGFWPARASRLVTTGLRPIETKEQACKLRGEVLIYCSEPEKLRGWGDLFLWLHSVGGEMARATPFLGREGPGKSVLRMGRDSATDVLPSLPLKNPIKVTLVFLDRRGRVSRTERHDIIELAHASLHT